MLCLYPRFPRRLSPVEPTLHTSIDLPNRSEDNTRNLPSGTKRPVPYPGDGSDRRQRAEPATEAPRAIPYGMITASRSTPLLYLYRRD
jgi:hypothetical protein